MKPVQYILDTNILVHYARGDEVWDRLRRSHELFVRDPRPLISVVTAGELWSIAFQRSWREKKLRSAEFSLGYFTQISIDWTKIIRQYALIDSHFKRRGIKYGKNDLWIAATASAMGAILLTTDRDFDAMNPLFLTREWINPAPVRG